MTSTYKRVTVLIGLLVMVLAVSSCKFDGAYDLPLPGGKAVSDDDGIKITAEFTDALNVVPRTAVMVDDVAVGQVTEVDRSGWHAKITLLVRKNLHLPKNTTAEIRQTSLLGEKYVALLRPTGASATGSATETASDTDTDTDSGSAKGLLRAGDNIPLAATGRNPEVEEVLGALSFLLSGGGVEQLKTISTELNDMMSGRTKDLRSVLNRVNVLVGTLDDQRGDIIKAMESIDKLSATLNKEKDTVGDAIDSMGPALKVLNQQHTALVKMLKELDRLGVVGTRVLDASKDNIVASLKHLGPALRELADSGDSLTKGATLLASFPFPKEASNLAMGDYANAAFYIPFDFSKIFGSGGFGDSSNLYNPIEICRATPLAPICATLDDSVINPICKLGPSNPLCPSADPAAPAATTTPKKKRAAPPATSPSLPTIPGLGGDGGATKSRSNPLSGLLGLLGGGSR